MIIGFLTKGTGISGGINVVLNYCLGLQELGHEIYLLSESGAQSDISWHKAHNKIQIFNVNQVPDDLVFDVLIATFWITSFDLPLFKSKKYAYFIQSIESRFYKEQNYKNFVDSSYVLPLFPITEAKWIKEYLLKNFNQNAFLVKNGIDKTIFHKNVVPLEKREAGKLRVLVEGPLTIDFKNTKKAIELALKSEADEVWLLTSSSINSFLGVDRVFSEIPMQETAAIYSSCDLVLKLSYVEGMFGPPLESFCCGGTAITFDVTGHDEYMVDGYNSIIIKTDEDEQVISAINKLKNDPLLLNHLKAGALETANNWPDWDSQTKEFETILKFINLKEDNNGFYLKNMSDLFKNFFEQSKHEIQIKEPSKASKSVFSKFNLKKSFLKIGKRLNYHYASKKLQKISSSSSHE